MDRDIGLCPCCDPQETIESGTKFVHDSPSIERHAVREETGSTPVFRTGNHRSGFTGKRAVSVV